MKAIGWLMLVILAMGFAVLIAKEVGWVSTGKILVATALLTVWVYVATNLAASGHWR